MTKGNETQPFVESTENSLGLGKLVACNGKNATVDYFRSPAEKEPIRREVTLASLTRKTLCPQTRVYYRHASSYSWVVGRVLGYQKDDACYFIRFPNDESRFIPSDRLVVRCRLPIDEPTDHLANQLNETAFWHPLRSEFVRHLMDQYQMSGGLSALLSSSVEIVAHQASVVRRVLTDPFQRYLLADEVGLGKTIEAGVLIKQFTLDEPSDHQTVVIVPEALRVQWQQELRHRFHLGELLGKSIHIVGSRDAKQISTYLPLARMIVVDEAHHLSSWAWSIDEQEKFVFDLVAKATVDLHRRVLLLSATPVLHNEKSFLAMLHLLDPQVYPLDSLDSFKQRVQLRQEIAERMMDLREDESNFFLGDTLDVLGYLLSEDSEFQTLRKELGQLVEQDVDEQDSRRIELIRSIRTHVSDMWRLHRRILRSRRTDATAAYLPGRGGTKRITYTCDKESGLAEAIAAWRLSLSASLFSKTVAEKEVARGLVRVMDEFASCEPRRALALATARLRGNAQNVTGSLPLFDGEPEMLQQIIRAATDCDHSARLQKLYQLIGNDDEQVSWVVFASEPETADLIFEFLDFRLPLGRVLRHACESSLWTQFKNEHRGYVLICDRAAEEGLNLQKRGACAIHYDLPFSPNRIEQRMGRLDRFGSGMPVQAAVLVCDGSAVQKRWFDLVDGALGVFTRSIASLQYVIDDSMQSVFTEYLDAGADAFVEASEKLGGDEGMVAKEIKRIIAQDSIDSFDTDVVTQGFADELENNDRKIGQQSVELFTKWLKRGLQFRISGEEQKYDDVFLYEFTRRVDYGKRGPYGKDTLMPIDEFKRFFANSIDDVETEKPTVFTTVPLTFDRVTSQRRCCRLLRVGDPFVNAIEAFTRWDDRGCSYAFWRFVPSYRGEEDPAVFFRFDFVVSPAIAPLKALCQRYPGASWSAVVRRTQTIMQPRFTMMWLDSDLERVTGKDDRAKLLMPVFSKGRTGFKEDFNLNLNRWDAVAKLYDMSLWRDRCIAARQTSEQLLRKESGLPKWSSDCVEKAEKQGSHILQQFRSRLAMANGEAKSSLEKDLQFEKELLLAQVEAFMNPDLRVDSVGAIFLSNRMPFDKIEEREDDD